MSELRICPLRFERVSIQDNRKVMLGCTLIAHADETGVKVYQSENRNVITVEHNGFFNHIILTEIVNKVLEESEALTK